MIKAIFFMIILILSITNCQANNYLNHNVKESEYKGDNKLIYPDALVLFEQKYSDIRKIPNNIFLINWGSEGTMNQLQKLIHKNIYDDKYYLDYSLESQGLEYVVNQKFTIITHLIDSLSRWHPFLLTKMKRGILDPCYICRLVPMTRCTYRMTLGLEADDPKSFTEIWIAGGRIQFHLLDNKTLELTTGYIAPNGTYVGKKLLTNGNANRFTFYIKYDGINKTNTLIYNDTYYAITPLYDYQRRSLPYPDISNSWIKFNNYVLGNGTFFKVTIYDIAQIAERKLITPIGYVDSIPFGLDGPQPPDTIEKGVELLKKNNSTGTLWFDVNYLDSYNDSQVIYLRDLVNNKSWEAGIHFSKELNKLPLSEAYDLMKKEYELVTNKISCKPVTWCSLKNSDNINHCIFAYNEFGMTWRNGESGVHGENERGIGNLDDDTWRWWKVFSEAGMIHPVFTHRTDEKPAQKWSISYDNFREWQNNYKKLNISPMPFGKWWKINCNTYEASFENITFKQNTIRFTANTNGYDSLINIKIKTTDILEIYDLTAKKVVSWELYQDDSIIFWVEDGHNYEIHTNVSSQYQ